MIERAGRLLRPTAIFMLCALVAAAIAVARAQEGDAGDAEAAVQALDARVTTTPERARLVVDLSGPAEFGVHARAEPRRMVVEVEAGMEEPAGPIDLGGEGLVGSYRIGPTEGGRVRAELILTAPAQVQQSYILEPFEDQPARLVIDLVPDTEANFLASLPEAEPDAVALDGTATPPGQTATPSATRPLIVLDPGHGGADAGAVSASGLEEKNIVLAFALKLQQILMETGRFDVALTRETDVFLRLEQRIALARQNQADLFISLHADSFDQEDVRGASVYTRGQNVSDLIDRVLVGEETTTDLVAAYGPVRDDPVIVDILLDLLGRETRRQSYLAARALVEQLEPSIQLRRFPLRQADYFVLQAPDVPSVLVELGFLSNTDDSENLATDAWLDRVAEALARGIAAHFDENRAER